MDNMTITLKDSKGDKYDFEGYELNNENELDELNIDDDEVECIYFYYKEVGSEQHFIYIGQTGNLYERLEGHKYDNECILNQNPTHIFVHQLPNSDEEGREKIEKSLIERSHYYYRGSCFPYRWKCNIEHNQ